MSPLVSEFIGSLLRWLMTLAFGYLATKHAITADQADRFSTALAEHLVLWVPLAVPLVWSLWARVRGRRLLIAHRELPEDASDSAVAARMQLISVRETLTDR